MDLRGLAVFRIALGLLVIVDVAFRFADLEAHYTDFGAAPRALIEAEHPPSLWFRIFFASGESGPTAALLGALAVAAGFVVAGCRTRVAVIVCWLLWCSLMARNPYVINFGDRFLRLMLLWAAFLPLDRALTRSAGRAAERGTSFLSVASGGYQIQIVAIYVFSALLKNHPIWTEGEAVRVVLLFDQLTRPAARALAEWPLVCEALTYGTLVLEAAVVLFVFMPWRNAAFRVFAVASVVALHVGIASTMRLGHFQFVCMAAWIPFLPAAFWDRVLPVGTGRASTCSPSGSSLPTNLAAGALLVVVLILNLGSLAPREEAWLPSAFTETAKSLGLRQHWSMFAPHPSQVDGWFVISGSLPSGLLVDLQREDRSPSWAKPEDPGAVHPNHRWMSSMVKLHVDRDRSNQKEGLAGFLCRRWNRDHGADAQIGLVAIDFVQELTLLDGTESRPIRLEVSRTACTEEPAGLSPDGGPR